MRGRTRCPPAASSSCSYLSWQTLMPRGGLHCARSQTPGATVKIETIAVRVGREVEPATGEVAPAVHLRTTFERDADGGYPRGYSYIRPDNPGRRALEQC